MGEDDRTFGKIRKSVEVKLSRAIGLSASEAQVVKIRELSPAVAEGRLSYDDALAEVQAVAD